MKIEQFCNKNIEEILSCQMKVEDRFKKLIIYDLWWMFLLVSYSPKLISQFVVLPISVTCFCKLFKDVNFFDENFKDLCFESVEFKEFYKVYNFILEEVIKLFKDLDINNESEIFAGYYYLLKNGYLSIDNKFYYENHVNDCLFFYCANVIEGYGNCVDISSMFTDLLNFSGIESYNISMMLDDSVARLNDEDLDCFVLDEEIESCIKSGDVNFLNKLKECLFHISKRRKRYNHLVTLSINDNNIVVMDATNNTIFGINKDFSSIHQNGRDYLIENKVILNGGIVRQNLKEILNNKYTSNFDVDKFLVDYNGSYNKCLECRDIFDKFYMEHKCLYEEIVLKKRDLQKKFVKYKYKG